MVPDWLQRLLILQDRDIRCDGILRQLEGIPLEIEREKAAIEKLRDEQLVLENEIRELEKQRLAHEGEVQDLEANIARYRIQQLQVKKNEEYTALSHEITSLEERISQIEDSELQLLEELDAKQEHLRLASETTREQIAVLESHISRLRENEESFRSELAGAREAVSACEQDIDPQSLQQYRYVKSQVKRPPVVVPLEDGRCQGCHLKVSGEVDSAARKAAELVRCDSCGRILYLDR